MGGFSVIVFAACLLVSSVGVSSGFVLFPGFGFNPAPNPLWHVNQIQNLVHDQIRAIGGIAARPAIPLFNGVNGVGVVSTAGTGTGGGVVSTGTGGGTVFSSTGGGNGGYVSTLGGGGGQYGGGSSSFVSSSAPGSGFGVIQTASNVNGKQSGQVLINDNGKVTAYELPPGGGTVFTVQSGQGGPGVASSSYQSSYSTNGEKSNEE